MTRDRRIREALSRARYARNHVDGIDRGGAPEQRGLGRGRLARALKRLCGKNPEVVADQILADMDEFSGGTPRFDDQTLIVLKVG